MAEKEKKHFFHARLNLSRYGSFATFINILIGYIDTVVLDNFFFILTSLGIITIGPGLASLHACFEDCVANRTEHRYRAYFRHFKEAFHLPIILLGLLLTGVYAALGYGFFFFHINLATHLWLTVFLVLDVFLFFFLARFFAYFFLQYVRMELPIKTLLKNAWLLSLSHPKEMLIGDVGFALFFLIPLVFIDRAFPLFIAMSFTGAVLSEMMSVYKIVDSYVLKDVDEDDDGEVKETRPNLRLDLLPDTTKSAPAAK
jgi:uncharacterized membrane protein YesL